MKKIIMLILIVCMVFGIYADGKTGAGSVNYDSSNEEDTKLGLDGTNATLKINFENINIDDVTIGFSNKPVSDFTALEDSEIVKTAELKRDPATATAVYGTAADSPLYVFWQIVSDDTVTLKLSASTINNENGALVNEKNNPLNWYVASYAEGNEGPVYVNTSNEANLADINTGHNPSVSTGKAGSQQILIRTADLNVAPAGTYTGNLVLTITATGN